MRFRYPSPHSCSFTYSRHFNLIEEIIQKKVILKKKDITYKKMHGSKKSILF